ncbi:peptidylprolyl isomerase [Clostridium sp. OM05-6BH]|jgi:peptidyl-prolyl cis-trans isomerase B (cyclophilin B)|uniref:peptidylprolyl isomerase n=1 Tax=unclassified Clostridium TaxID=2614128 RepID=UPI000E50E339|nr:MULTISPECIES: peptidylprolyl isomerase [unclassified Clostridium]RHV15318.1 peptidylprolyl isomerase [Clostridium sp. OM05-9BH]RHV18756.1 peptidylprolyl isomerase [Clostridium sp. OM05-6BH]
MKRLISIILMAALLSLCLTGCGDTRENADKSTAKTTKKESFAEKKDADTSNSQYLTGKHHAEIVIAEYGKLELELDADVAPITVTNFVNLVKKGFYNGLTFHRIMSGFMIQGGDPNGDGTGGSEETIKGEFKSNGVENTMSHKRGVISMARTQNDPDSASSQFFIVQADSDFLDGDYAAFGKVTAGMDIVDKICQSVQPIDNNGTVPADQQPKITAIKVID